MRERGSIDRVLEEEWMPRLVGVWRRLTGRSGSATSLDESELEEVSQAIHALSRGLVGERELIGSSYLEDASMLGAYLLYFWPVSYAQGRRVLAEVGGVSGACLDVGGGPGPMTFAALDEGASAARLLERSQGAINAAQALARAASKRLVAERVDMTQYIADGEKRGVIIAGHSIGEFFSRSEDRIERRAALCERLIAQLDEGGVLVLIEPALRETSRELLEVRDLLVARGHGIIAPCLRGGTCPALERERDWCHSDREWVPPALVESLMTRAGLKKHTLKMSYLVFGGAAGRVRRGPGLFRIVSEPLHTKGRLHYIGCGERGRHGLTMLTRHKGEARQVFEGLVRGDVVSLSELEERGDGLRLGKGSEVQRVSRVGEPPPGSSVEHN